MLDALVLLMFVSPHVGAGYQSPSTLQKQSVLLNAESKGSATQGLTLNL